GVGGHVEAADEAALQHVEAAQLLAGGRFAEDQGLAAVDEPLAVGREPQGEVRGRRAEAQAAQAGEGPGRERVAVGVGAVLRGGGGGGGGQGNGGQAAEGPGGFLGGRANLEPPPRGGRTGGPRWVARGRRSRTSRERPRG